MKNKKGFTLVELLAVIVILALIMSIAVISIGGVLNSTRQSTFRESAAGIIDGVRQQLLIHNALPTSGSANVTKSFFFKKGILEKGGDKSPLGGDLVYYTDGATLPNGVTATKVGDFLSEISGTYACSKTSMSFVTVTFTYSTKLYSYKICLTAGSGNYYIKDATENDLLTNENANTWLVNT